MKLTRRDFVKSSIAAATFLTAGRSALGQMMGGGGMMGGGTTIDPPPGAAFKDPVVMPNLSTTQGLVEVNVEAKVSPVNVNGTIANLLTYNDSYPAPTIRANKGDILKVHFKNSFE